MFMNNWKALYFQAILSVTSNVLCLYRQRAMLWERNPVFQNNKVFQSAPRLTTHTVCTKQTLANFSCRSLAKLSLTKSELWPVYIIFFTYLHSLMSDCVFMVKKHILNNNLQHFLSTFYKLDIYLSCQQLDRGLFLILSNLPVMFSMDHLMYKMSESPGWHIQTACPIKS